jgi:ubiquitin carboxyl-terminal hydrolase 7
MAQLGDDSMSVDDTTDYPEDTKCVIPKDDEVLSQSTFEMPIDEINAYPDSAEHRTESIVQDGFAWRFLVYPAGKSTNAMGVFFEIDHEHPEFKYKAGTPYTIFLHAKLSVVSATNEKWNMSKVFRKKFCDAGKRTTGMNWGFKSLLPVGDLNDAERGYLTGQTCQLRAEWTVTDGGDPNVWGDDSTYDSHKRTGMVGIQNQGMTCYMNSVLQSLYHSGGMRMGVYAMPTEAEEDPTKSVAIGIQRVFYRLQTHKKAVSTQELTKSFGWNLVDSFTQHDVQEFLRVLLDSIESKMKGTDQENFLQTLYVGKVKSFLRCINVEYESSREEDFLDIQLTVKGNPNLEKAFEDYCEIETMEGDNQYQAEGHGKQDAKKGSIFTVLPPVLNIQLRRFEYDFMRDESNKVYDHFEYADKINLDKFMDKRGDSPANYTLHSVLVQGGDTTSGHYIVYCRPNPTGDWFKFDDENCIRVAPEEAIEQQFGSNEETLTRAARSSAYMLVYIRDDRLADILPTLNASHIPTHLHARFEKEEEEQEMARKEEESALTYLTIVLMREHDLVEHNAGWKALEFPPQMNPYGDAATKGALFGTTIKVEKTCTLKEAYEQIHAELSQSTGSDKPIESLRLFPWEHRENRTNRPGPALVSYPSSQERTKMIGQMFSNGKFYGKHKCIVTAAHYASEPSSEERDERILITCKFYDPSTGLRVVKVVYPSQTDTVMSLHDEMVETLQLPAGTRLTCNEELRTMSYPECELDGQLKADAELQTGDILVWAVASTSSSTSNYLEKLCSEVTVCFKELSEPGGEGITMLLDDRMNYAQTVAALATKLELPDPDFIQLTTHDPPKTWQVGGPSDKVSSRSLKNLGELAYPPYTRSSKSLPGTLYYAKISTPIAEFESLTKFEVVLLKTKAEDEKTSVMMDTQEYTVYGPADQTCSDLIKQVLDAAHSTLEVQHCRLVQFYWNKLKDIDIPHDRPMSQARSTFDSYRVEEIPEDERVPPLGVLQKRVEVFHIVKLLTRRHGIPFLFMLRDGETVKDMRVRLAGAVGCALVKFNTWKVGHVVQVRSRIGTYEDQVQYFEDDAAVIDFKTLPEDLEIILDHADNSKGMRAAANVADIKIHN